MRNHAAWVAAVFSVLTCATAFAQQSAETAEPNATPAEGAAAPANPAATPAVAAKAEAAEPAKGGKAAEDLKGADNDALLRAQAAGYKLVDKDGKQVFCKKEMVTGSRLATRTRCLTLAQLEAERNATKDMLLDMSRKTINIERDQ